MIEFLARLFFPETPEEELLRNRDELRRENLRAITSLPNYRRQAGSTDHELAQLRSHRIRP